MPYAERWKSPSHEDTNILLMKPELAEPIDTTTVSEAQFGLPFDAVDILYSAKSTRMTSWRSILQLLRHAGPIKSYIITIEPQKTSEIATWSDTSRTSGTTGFTTVNIEQEEFYKQIIQSWQRRKILEQFDVLAQQEDNWDEYESKKPTESTLAHAKLLTAELLDSINSAGYLCSMPFISSDEDGYITVEWHKGTRELHFDIEENEAEYTKISGPNTNMKIHTDFLNRDDYLMLWEWLIDG